MPSSMTSGPATLITRRERSPRRAMRRSRKPSTIHFFFFLLLCVFFSSSQPSPLLTPIRPPVISENELEMVLPGGKVLGHRSLNRYYKQKFKPEDVSYPLFHIPLCCLLSFLELTCVPLFPLDPHLRGGEQAHERVPRPRVEHRPEGEVARADHAAPRP